MIIKMNKDAVGSFNGVDTKLYAKDSVCKVEHPQERHLFEYFVRTGAAEWYDPSAPAKEYKVAAPAEAKIATPKAKKTKAD